MPGTVSPFQHLSVFHAAAEATAVGTARCQDMTTERWMLPWAAKGGLLLREDGQVLTLSFFPLPRQSIPVHTPEKRLIYQARGTKLREHSVSLVQRAASYCTPHHDASISQPCGIAADHWV